MSKVQVAMVDGKATIEMYLDKQNFNILNSVGYGDKNKPLLVIVSYFKHYKFENTDRTLYFAKSKLNPNGYKKVKAFNCFTKSKIPILNKINELNLSSYVNPILYTSFRDRHDIINLIDNYEKLPNDLIIKNELGAKQNNVCFVNKEVFLDALHLIEAYCNSGNAPDDVFDNLKPVRNDNNNFKNFMFGDYMYVEEDLTDRITSEYRILYGFNNKIMVCERSGYGRQEGKKEATHIKYLDTFESFFNHIGYKNRSFLNKWFKHNNIRTFIEWMDAPIISLDILVLNDGEDFTIIESSNEFAFKRFCPIAAKEFINDSYISYCKHHKLIK